MSSINVNYSSSVSNTSNACKLMLFDLFVYGHHSSYIQHLINYWYEQELLASLDIVVSPNFLTEHPDIATMASENEQTRVKFVAITQEEEAALKPMNSSISRTFHKFQEWNLFCKYARLLQANHALIMYFDILQLPLVVGLKPPCPFSGIYFRPTFHYSEFSNYSPSRKDIVRQWQDKLQLNPILRCPQFKTLFILDPFAVKHLKKFRTQTKVVHLPDPVEISDGSQLNLENFKQNLGIQPDRQVFLLFGALTGRKGIYKLLESIAQLSPNLCQKLCLLLVGEVDEINKAKIQSQAAIVRQSRPVQILEHYGFVPEQNVATYFHLADVVLAPYQRHVGMSGILILAAAAQKPVLSSNYGLMGEIVRQHGLGLTIDSAVPREITQGLTRFLSEAPEKCCDRRKMKIFAKQNSAKRFASVIFQNIFRVQNDARGI